MNSALKSGLTGKSEIVKVENEHSAQSVGSGSLSVLATPVLAAIFEKAACNAIDHLLDDGVTSVGTYLEINHTAATPLGMRVTVTAELIEVNDRLLKFKLSAADEAGPIGTGLHHRVLVSKDRFIMKVEAKLKR